VVTEFNYRLASRTAAHIFVDIATDSRADAQQLRESLVGAGYAIEDLADNELAKLHVRHMVGGRSAAVRDERLYRFEVPETELSDFAAFLEQLGYPRQLEQANPAYELFLA
jgi:threonine dehydratase